MITVDSIEALRKLIKERRQQGQTIGFIPTMGNLHEGHLSLVAAAKQRCQCTVTSIYVNPTQFGPNEDFDNYPRTEVSDSKRLAAIGNDILFMPSTETIYPNGQPPEVSINIPGVSAILCGASRANHFSGVAIVVSKLFNLVQPDIAFFGEKDFQQLHIIKRLVKELAFPIEIVGVPTTRESNGLAMSSRNQYLSSEERNTASQLYHTLLKTAAKIKSGQITPGTPALEEHIEASLESLSQHAFQPDYFEIRQQDDLSIPTTDSKQIVLLIAAKLGKARLIDNLSINL